MSIPFWGRRLPRAMANAALPEPVVPPGAPHLNPGSLWALGDIAGHMLRLAPPRGGTGVRPHPADVDEARDALLRAYWTERGPETTDEVLARLGVGPKRWP